MVVNLERRILESPSTQQIVFQPNQLANLSNRDRQRRRGKQASIRHSIPGGGGFVAITDAAVVTVAISRTILDEEETPEPPTTRQVVQQVQLPPTDYDQELAT